MVIQHNIMATNSQNYYNKTAENSQKILEKLSSGYRINRAGDDAAGLAISEKMRAQITGLVAAQKNCGDAGNLLTTAEGGLQEIHAMLNRAVELATQSANGTYNDNANRDKLQMEFDEIRTEIDRIAQGTNFNSIDLLHSKHKNDTMKMIVQHMKNFAAFQQSSRTTQITGFLQKNLSKITQSTVLAASKMEEIAAEFIPELSTIEIVNNVNNITPPPILT